MTTIFTALIRGDEQLIALIGAGGKTSLMFSLAHAFQRRGIKVITATTTRILFPTPEQSSHVLLCSKQQDISARLEKELENTGHVTLAKRILPGNKLEGLPCSALEEIFGQSSAQRMIVEADGARTLPLKAPGANEPVVPAAADLYIGVAGLDCIGRPLSKDTTFRPQQVAALTGLAMGADITPGTVARLAVHPLGMLKGCPPGTRSLIFLNKIDKAGGLEKAQQVIAAAADKPGTVQPDSWLAGSVRDNECVVLREVWG